MPAKKVNICKCCKHEIINKLKKSKYCKDCARFHHNLRMRIYNLKRTEICGSFRCKKKFKPTKKNQIYCSAKCNRIQNQLRKKCRRCGEPTSGHLCNGCHGTKKYRVGRSRKEFKKSKIYYDELNMGV